MLILSTALLNIALLLLPLSSTSASKMDTTINPAIADAVPAKPLMTGVRLTSWDDQRQLFLLEIESLEPITKTVGPFQMDDFHDISAIHCYLRSGSASLSGEPPGDRETFDHHVEIISKTDVWIFRGIATRISIPRRYLQGNLGRTTPSIKSQAICLCNFTATGERNGFSGRPCHL